MDDNVRYKIRVRGIINVTRVPYGRLRIPSLLWALDLAPTMSIARLHFIKYKPVNNLTHAGTGKTVIAAFDYRNFRKKHQGEACRLLFVAHREEILKQSRDTFQGVLRDLNFGELFVGNYVPDNLDNLFSSVQKMNSQKY